MLGHAGPRLTAWPGPGSHVCSLPSTARTPRPVGCVAPPLCSVPRQQAAADAVTTDYLGTAVERVQQLRKFASTALRLLGKPIITW